DPARPPGRVDAHRVFDVLVEPDTLVPHALRFVEETRVFGEADPVSVLANDVRLEYETPTPGNPRTIVAIPQQGWTFYWPSNPHGAGPMQLADTAECRQLLACCQALSQRSEEDGRICA